MPVRSAGECFFITAKGAFDRFQIGLVAVRSQLDALGVDVPNSLGVALGAGFTSFNQEFGDSVD